MKRVLTVLVALLISAASLFASDTATIQVKTTVIGTSPEFALSDGVEISGASETKYHELAPELLLSSEDSRIDFSIIQTNSSNRQVNVTLTVTATDLVLLKDGQPISDYTDSQRFRCKDKTPTITVNGNAGYTSSADNNEATLHYNGRRVQSNSTIATFYCNWQPNPDAQGGDYEATIKLSIQSL